MVALWLILVLAVSLQAKVDATQVTFSKKNGMIYVETDPKHYGLYGQVLDEDGIRIIAVNEEGRYQLTSKCRTNWVEFNKINQETLHKYSLTRKLHLASKGNPKESPEDYVWSESFTKDDNVAGGGQQQPAVVRKLDDNTLVYASKYFPSFLARLIISGKVVIYVQYNGLVTIKTMDCLYLNEKIFIEGIKKIDPDKRMIPLVSSEVDEVLKKHLKSSNFNENKFNFELSYLETFTKTELTAKHPDWQL